MGYSIELEIAIGQSDSNRILGRSWKARKGVFDRIKQEVILKTVGKRPEEPLKKFKLHFSRHSSKTLDYDNYISSLKPVIDALRYLGIIFDDNWNYINHLNMSVDQKISIERKIVIRVEEV